MPRLRNGHRRYMVTPQLIKRGRLSRVLKKHREMRLSVWLWFKDWDGNPDELLARYDDLKPYERLLCVQRMGVPYREEALRCMLHAAYQVMPAKHPNALTQKYSPPQLMAVNALRWWLGVGHLSVIRHLQKHEPERYLIFGRIASLPDMRLLKWHDPTFEAYWPQFILTLAEINLGAAKTIHSNRLGGISDEFSTD